jgi:hypothetical protein
MMAINPLIFRIIHINQKLHVGAVLIFRGIDQQETQAAPTNERGDMGDTRLGLDEALDLAGERFGFADMGAGRQEGIHHELRPVAGKALITIQINTPRRGPPG